MSSNDVTNVNVYMHDGEWCYVAWTRAGEFDNSDTLGVDGDEAAAISEAQEQFPDATVRRIANGVGQVQASNTTAAQRREHEMNRGA